MKAISLRSLLMKTRRSCPGCFQALREKLPCPACGYGGSRQRPAISLPTGTRLNNRYRIGNVLGQPGGFGITYLARDALLQTLVAIKEYFPDGIAARAQDTSVAVQSTTPSLNATFDRGLGEFLQEARIVARINHPNVVRVRDFFEENGTAYMIMDYYEGVTLEHGLAHHDGYFDEVEAFALALALLDGLETIHRAEILHLDLKPANIFLVEEQPQTLRPIILDFGAARWAIDQPTQRLDQIYTPRYAAYEQYLGRGLGPWTDLYALAAILYQAVTSVLPPEASERLIDDTLLPPKQRNPSLSDRFNETLMAGLAFEPTDRPQSVADFRKNLTQGTHAVVLPPLQPSNGLVIMWQRIRSLFAFPDWGWWRWTLNVLGMAIAGVMVATLIWLLIPTGRFQNDDGDHPEIVETPPDTSAHPKDNLPPSPIPCALPVHPGTFTLAVDATHNYDVVYDRTTHYLENESYVRDTLSEVCETLKEMHHQYYDQIKNHLITMQGDGGKAKVELTLTILRSRTRPL